MTSPDYQSVLEALRSQESARPLSILNLAEPITSSQPAQTDDASTTAATSRGGSFAPSEDAVDSSSLVLTPASLAADLAHYRDLFSKLRFSYLEQVTKEKYLRSIVGDPPLLVGHDDNLALERKLAVMKADLKAHKTEVDVLVAEMEEQARVLAVRYESVHEKRATLEVVGPEVERLRTEIAQLKAEWGDMAATKGENLDDGRRDPRYNMSLDTTQQALADRRARTAEVDAQIEQLRRQMVPAKTREVEKMDRELAELERRRNESTRLAIEMTRRREARSGGGRDEVEDLGRWYRGSEAVLKGVLGVES